MMAAIGIVVVIVSIPYFALAKSAGYADRQLEELQRRSNLRKEISADGNLTVS